MRKTWPSRICVRRRSGPARTKSGARINTVRPLTYMDFFRQMQTARLHVRKGRGGTHTAFQGLAEEKCKQITYKKVQRLAPVRVLVRYKICFRPCARHGASTQNQSTQYPEDRCRSAELPADAPHSSDRHSRPRSSEDKNRSWVLSRPCPAVEAGPHLLRTASPRIDRLSDMSAA